MESTDKKIRIKKLPSLPKSLSQVGLIHNASKEEELLLIGSYEYSDIYAYNINSQEYKRVINLEKAFGNTTGVSALSGTINNIDIVVVFGGSSNRRLTQKPYFKMAVVNTKTMKLCLSNNGEMKNQDEMVHTTGCRGHLYNEYFIVSGGYTGSSLLSIYQLNVVKNNMIEARMRKQVMLPSDSQYRYHGSVLFEIDKSTIQVILCGGESAGFKKSFLTVLIDLSDKREIQIEFKSNAFSDVDFAPLKLAGIDIAERYWGFTCHLIKNRYIIFIGGNNIDTQEILDSIFYFDTRLRKWHVCNKHLPSKLCDHSSIVLNNCNGNLINILGGCRTPNSSFTNYVNYHWQIHIGQIFSNLVIQWKNERIIWVGFEKNENNTDSCFLAKMPKDIIVHILSFLKFDN